MKILFTGASSFTGFWFIKELSLSGHHVTAIFSKPLVAYAGLRKQRIDLLQPLCRCVFDCEFGSQHFLDVIASESQWELLCHHAADVTDYKSPHFNIAAAISNNTKNLSTILDQLVKKNCHKIILTGSVFEQQEGQGSDDLRAFSPYGLSKGFTSEIFKYHAHQAGMKLGKFVIPNPFGPYEEPRFTSYLMQNWMKGKVAAVNTPNYVRDNIPVSLLAKAYVHFSETASKNYEKFNPSGYVESQGEFTKRFAEEMSKRLNLACQYTLADQKQFSEPLTRTNSDSLSDYPFNWNENESWDQLATYYKTIQEV